MIACWHVLRRAAFSFLWLTLVSVSQKSHTFQHLYTPVLLALLAMAALRITATPIYTVSMLEVRIRQLAFAQ
jgi:hypothetical protein